MSVSLIQGLPTSMKMAREYALLGHYDTAAVYFDGAMKMMDQYLRTVSDRNVINQWKQAKQELSAEMKLIKELDTEVRAFDLPPGAGAVPPAAPVEKPVGGKNPPPPSYRGGASPAARDVPVSVEVPGSRKQHAKPPKEDPDIWDAPPVKEPTPGRRRGNDEGQGGRLPAWARGESQGEGACGGVLLLRNALG